MVEGARLEIVYTAQPYRGFESRSLRRPHFLSALGEAKESVLKIHKIAAFSRHNSGGNPAGVVICDNAMPAATEMLNIAATVGYSETAFLQRQSQQRDDWRVRYFAPTMEVPFCGHATIAAAAVLGEQCGIGTYTLTLNEGTAIVSVARSESGVFSATLTSPETQTMPAPPQYVAAVLAAFNFSAQQLNVDYPPRIAFAGARHLILILKSRETLATMSYHFERVKTLMTQQQLITINMAWMESPQRIHSRNAFAAGGVYEDPATGAAAAALAGYLRERWGGGGHFEIIQGEDMGMPSRLLVRYGANKGEGVEVGGETRYITG